MGVLTTWAHSVKCDTAAGLDYRQMKKAEVGGSWRGGVGWGSQSRSHKKFQDGKKEGGKEGV